MHGTDTYRIDTYDEYTSYNTLLAYFSDNNQIHF